MDEQETPIDELTLKEVVEEVKPKKSAATLNKAVVAILPGSFTGTAYIGVSGDGTGYLVPRAYIDSEEGSTVSIDLADKEVKLLYNWTKEIEAAIPTKNEIVANIRKALWMNGAFDKQEIKKSAVQRNLMRGAFPYRIELLEEE